MAGSADNTLTLWDLRNIDGEGCNACNNEAEGGPGGIGGPGAPGSSLDGNYGHTAAETKAKKSSKMIVTSLSGHTKAISCVNMLQEGTGGGSDSSVPGVRRILSGSFDTSLRVWTIQKSEVASGGVL